MAKTVLIKPVISEKADKMAESANRYTFYVHTDSNKIEIKKAVEAMFGVDVKAVNTSFLPRKFKSRFTKAGALTGTTALKKKAIITLAEGEEIDFYDNI